MQPHGQGRLFEVAPGTHLRDDERLIRRFVAHHHEDVTTPRLTTRARAVIVQIDAVKVAWTEAQERSQGQSERNASPAADSREDGAAAATVLEYWD